MREAAVRVVTSRGGHGSGSLIKYKGLTLVLTAQHVADGGLGSDYWIMRVPLSDKQAVVAFPKFTTVGIGFQYEDDDWNVNLPYQCEAREIYNHIRRNKGDDSIPDESCVKAIEMLKVTISQMMATGELEV